MTAYSVLCVSKITLTTVGAGKTSIFIVLTTLFIMMQYTHVYKLHDAGVLIPLEHTMPVPTRLEKRIG